jgi:hypothetical protein
MGPPMAEGVAGSASGARVATAGQYRGARRGVQDPIR